ncbi:MAG TPA: Fic family protein [Acidimicrobiales bacterium]|nr:Fic family protein [Acidimicrobiales bacterium]
MEPSQFASRERGVVRRCPAGDYWAFFPAPLPTSAKYSTQTSLLLDDATGALFRLGGVGRLLPNPTLLIGPHVRLEAVLSSRIEGTESELSDLLRFEAGEPDRGDDRHNSDVREVHNYIVALDHGLARLREGFPLSLRLIREVHERLMQGVRGEMKTPGEFRRSQNWIGGISPGDATFVPPPLDEMNAALQDWEQFLHRRSAPLLLQLAMAHYQFEVIHPFLDGNGRVGRLLVPLLLIERGALPQPLLYLSVYFERKRQEYYDLLLWTSQRGDFDPWFQFFLRGVAVQARDAEERTVRLVEMQAQLRNELLAARVSNTVVRLAEMLFDRPYITSASVQRDVKVTQPTAQSAIDTLVDRQLLREVTGRQRGRMYFSPGIFEAVYDRLDEHQEESPTEAGQEDTAPAE